MRGVITIALLVLSNVFMTLAWYGHLQWKESSWLKHAGIWAIILFSWGLAFFEYVMQVPANRIGFKENGGPFSFFELKTIQEAISLIVFTLFLILVVKSEKLAWNHFLGFGLILLAVYVIFKKW
ncbi:DMT family protein [Aquirufa aurantiipilula]|uniref:DMT family protein n=1 Tax=Aquirufa aurantiipilula TaxID=2696561 RepID=UPI001CAA44AE|nr:DMT family protein [Aquirufa aurantiipilula]MBZ1326219.1 DMT family protein [Aquirufa aurantiipilula]